MWYTQEYHINAQSVHCSLTCFIELTFLRLTKSLRFSFCFYLNPKNKKETGFFGGEFHLFYFPSHKKSFIFIIYGDLY